MRIRKPRVRISFSICLYMPRFIRDDRAVIDMARQPTTMQAGRKSHEIKKNLKEQLGDNSAPLTFSRRKTDRQMHGQTASNTL